MRFPVLSAAAAIAAAGILLSAAPALAEVIKFKAELTSAAELPPNPSTATGLAEVAYDTDATSLSWTITYTGLSGEPTAVNFHGPAKDGATAPAVVALKGGFGSPINGTSTLPPAQVADLRNGLWYFNIHTAKYPDGEIRGQLRKE